MRTEYFNWHPVLTKPIRSVNISMTFKSMAEKEGRKEIIASNTQSPLSN